MNVSELITHLAAFASQSPENASAMVLLQTDTFCMPIAKGQNCKGEPGQHFLVLVPNEQYKIGIKELNH